MNLKINSLNDENNTTQLAQSLQTILPEDFVVAPEHINEMIFLIKHNIDTVLKEVDYNALIYYLKKIYVIQNHQVNHEIQELLQHKDFKVYINDYIKNNIGSILNNDSIYSFEEISFFIFLLGFGEFNNILIDFNTYDFVKLHALLQKYITDISQDRETENRFESFSLVAELMNKIAILNQTDTQRKYLIPKIINILQENISQLFSLLENKNVLTQEKKNILNNLLGKLGVNFSHIDYIETENRNIDEILDEYLRILSLQSDGYEKSKQAIFGNNPGYQKVVYQTYLGNVAYAISTLISKVKILGIKDIASYEKFQDIVKIFYENIEQEYDETTLTLDEVQSNANDIFIGIYNDNIHINSVHKKTSYDIIQQFISDKSIIDDFQIESIHHLVLFSNTLSLQDYLEIGMFLVQTEKFNNYNFEFFKLKIIDFIISKIPEGLITSDIDIFFTHVSIYIENNKIASQLLNNYARIYLSMAFHYSKDFSSVFQQRAMECYSLFYKMGGENFDYTKYKNTENDFFYNLGLAKIKMTLCDCEYTKVTCIPIKNNHENCDFNYEQILKFGKARIQQYMDSYDGKVKNDVDRILSDLLDNALNSESLQDIEINNKISIVLSNKIFYGIAQVKIFHIKEDKGFIEDIVLHNGLSTQVIDILDEYKMLFIYPKVFQNIFYEIFQDQYLYIIRNIKNIISSYIKRKKMYIDHTTGLPNELKLKTILSQGQKTNSFMSIKLNTLKNINNAYNYTIGDDYIKKVAETISQIEEFEGKVYRLSGAKLGILFSNISQEELQEYVSKLHQVRFSFLGNIYKLDIILGLSYEEGDRLVEKSNIALSYAKHNSNRVYMFHEKLNDVEKNKELLEYLTKLESALEEDRIVPFFQPKFCAKTRMITGYEALLRIKNEHGEHEAPYKYLLSAGYFGRLQAVALRMIYKVFEYASINHDYYAINLSGDDLRNEELLPYILKTQQYFGIYPSRITFEILEGEWNDGDDNLETIKKLKKMGYKIAMDDFGADNSNINRLLDLLKEGYINSLKIDGKIIKTLTEKEGSIDLITNKLLSGIISAAHTADVQVTAEYVENDAILQACRLLGVDELQGYHLGKPEKEIQK